MFGGIVEHGDGLGRQYGSPTANLKCSKKDVDMSGGVYAAYAEVDRQRYKATLAIQENPWKVEVHLFDFDDDVYGKYMSVEPVQKVGEYQSYDTTAELVDKIQSDLEMVRNMLL